MIKLISVFDKCAIVDKFQLLLQLIILLFKIIIVRYTIISFYCQFECALNGVFFHV